jgi:hypothetical protein
MLGLSGICMLEEEGRKSISFKLRDSEIAVEKNTQKHGRKCGKVHCMLTEFFSAEKVL